MINDFQNHRLKHPTYSNFMIIEIYIVALAFVFTSSLLIYQIYLINKGFTTYDKIANTFEKYGNPFDKGFCKNLNKIFCKIPKSEFIHDNEKSIEISKKTENSCDESKLNKLI